MTPDAFVRTIYLGDRACTGILFDGWNDEVKLRVNCISRVRGPTWNFYNDENLEDGFIVFEGVTRVAFNIEGEIPNDEIVRLDVQSIGDGKYRFSIEIQYFDQFGSRISKIELDATGIALEPAGSDLRIRD